MARGRGVGAGGGGGEEGGSEDREPIGLKMIPSSALKEIGWT